MTHWLRRLRAALGMGLTWAVGWGLVGMAIELVHNVWPNPLGSLVDIWPAVLGYPAFIGGVAFSGVLAVAGRRRSFDELSLPGVAGWGGMGGLVLGLFPAALVAMGVMSVGGAAVIIGAFTLLGAVSASGTLLLARTAQGRELPGPGSEVGAAGSDAREPPGG